MRAIFQKKDQKKKRQKRQNIWKFGQKYTKFENIMKKVSLMRATIACMKQLEYALCYNGRRWSSLFQIKGNTKILHGHDIVYHVNCPGESCEDSYIVESGRRPVEHINNHNSRDNKLHVLKHSIEKNWTELNWTNSKSLIKILKINRKVFETLLIK